MTQRNPGSAADKPRQPHAMPLDRRAFLRLTGAAGTLGAAGPLLSACSTSSGGHISGKGTGAKIKEYVPGPESVSGGKYGVRVKVAWSDPPDPFDPALGENLTAWDCLTELVYFGSLMAYDKQFGGPVPNLAAAPPVISKDGKTLTFKIRPGVKFHNGRTIVAADFKYAWERMLDPKLQSWGASYLSSVVGTNAVMGGKTKKLEGVETQGDSTLIMHLTAPDFTILNALTQPITARCRARRSPGSASSSPRRRLATARSRSSPMIRRRRPRGSRRTLTTSMRGCLTLTRSSIAGGSTRRSSCSSSSTARPTSSVLVCRPPRRARCSRRRP